MPPAPSGPPPRMTWGRALPVLALCVIFDAIRLVFEQFWFFGPAFAAIGTSAFASQYVGSTIGSAVGAAVGVGAGAFGGVALQAFGIIMAMAVGLFGWATVTLILYISNPRLFKADTWAWIWSLASLAISEVPFVGTLPMLTITHVRLYIGQMKRDKEALKKYTTEQAKVTAFVRARQEQERRLAASREIPEDDTVTA